MRHARDLGFSLDDVRQLLTLADSDPKNPCGDVDQIARAHMAAVDAKIAQLTALRRELGRLTADCDRSTGIGDCSLLSALR